MAIKKPERIEDAFNAIPDEGQENFRVFGTDGASENLQSRCDRKHLSHLNTLSVTCVLDFEMLNMRYAHDQNPEVDPEFRFFVSSVKYRVVMSRWLVTKFLARTFHTPDAASLTRPTFTCRQHRHSAGVDLHSIPAHHVIRSPRVCVHSPSTLSFTQALHRPGTNSAR